MAYRHKSTRAFHARVAGFVDYVTAATPTKIDINLTQDNFTQILPLMSRFRYYKAKGLSVMAQPATTLPLNPMQIGDGASQVKATDILTPCAVRRFFNEYDTVTKDADGVTQVLSDPKWQKFWPQRGFRMYFKPYMYGVGSTATGPLRLNGTLNNVTGTVYYQPAITGLNGDDNDPTMRAETAVRDSTGNQIKSSPYSGQPTTNVNNAMVSRDSGPMTVNSPNWPDGTAPVREAWGAWGGIKPIGVQPVRRSIDGEFSFPMINVGRIFMPGYTSVVYTWRLWWTLYVDLMSPKFHLEPGESGLDSLMMGANMTQRETVFSADGNDITGTLYDTVQDPADETFSPSAEPQL